LGIDRLLAIYALFGTLILAVVENIGRRQSEEFSGGAGLQHGNMRTADFRRNFFVYEAHPSSPRVDH
jgi:hypothetical protein